MNFESAGFVVTNTPLEVICFVVREFETQSLCASFVCSVICVHVDRPQVGGAIAATAYGSLLFCSATHRGKSKGKGKGQQQFHAHRTVATISVPP
jgi:hypothetical protein